MIGISSSGPDLGEIETLVGPSISHVFSACPAEICGTSTSNIAISYSSLQPTANHRSSGKKKGCIGRKCCGFFQGLYKRGHLPFGGLFLIRSGWASVWRCSWCPTPASNGRVMRAQGFFKKIQKNMTGRPVIWAVGRVSKAERKAQSGSDAKTMAEIRSLPVPQ